MSQGIIVVVNPASANGRTGRRWPELASKLRGQIDDFEAVFTKAPKEATSIVRAAVTAGARHVISVGGDGTHNEVVNGLFAGGELVAEDVTLSLVPTGTGGDLRRTVGLPVSPLEAIEYVGRDPQPVDVGRLTYVAHDGEERTDHFINIASFGISGLVDKVVNESSKALGGKLSFLLGVARATLKYRNQTCRVVLDPGTPGERHFEQALYNGVVANARYFGGGMKVAPTALMGDGLFDVILMGDMGLMDVLTGTGAIYKGTHLDRDKIEHYRARVITAEPVGDEEVLIDMDGEQPGRLPASFEILPAVVRLCRGPNAEDAAI
jgi:YegS/Rv2252/BmrU family lipid kinase